MDLDDAGCTDKRQRYLAIDSGHLSLGSKTAELSAVGVALDEHIHGRQTWRALIVMGGKIVRQQNQAGAGAQHGHALSNTPAEFFEHA